MTELPFAKKMRIVNKELLKAVAKRPCDVCGKIWSKLDPNFACHIITRGHGGDDIEDNLYSGCLAHHNEQGQQGWNHMFNKYPFFRQVIYNKGFTLNGYKQLRRE